MSEATTGKVHKPAHLMGGLVVSLMILAASPTPCAQAQGVGYTPSNTSNTSGIKTPEQIYNWLDKGIIPEPKTSSNSITVSANSFESCIVKAYNYRVFDKTGFPFLKLRNASDLFVLRVYGPKEILTLTCRRNIGHLEVTTAEYDEEKLKQDLKKGAGTTGPKP